MAKKRPDVAAPTPPVDTSFHLGRRALLSWFGAGAFFTATGTAPEVQALALPIPLTARLFLLRPEDLLSILVEFYNAQIDPENPRQAVQVNPHQAAYLAFVFGPQHVADQVFDEASTATLPTKQEAQIAGPTRLVLRFPEEGVLPLSTASLLEMLRNQEMVLPTAALSNTAPTSAPTVRQTSLELPARLLLSPAKTARWSHRYKPMEQRSGPIELWRTRLAAAHPFVAGELLEGPSAARTLRAVWARGTPLLDPNSCVDEPTPTLADQSLINGSPWASSLTNANRARIVGASTGGGRPIAVQELALSALGATFDVQGNWADAPFCNLLAWKHAASQGRDVKVEVVMAGYLLPFGHRVALVTLSERKFRDAEAPLLQRRFLVFPEPRADLRPGPSSTPAAVAAFRQLPFTQVTVDLSSTPDLYVPPNPTDNHGAIPLILMSDPSVPFLVPVTGLDHAGRRVHFRIPMVMALNPVPDGDAPPPSGMVGIPTNKATDQFNAALSYMNLMLHAWPSDLGGQRVAMAPPTALTESVPNDDTTVEARSFTWQVEGATAPLVEIPIGPAAANCAVRFAPKVSAASVVIESARQLTGKADPVSVKYFEGYATSGFPDAGVTTGPNVNEVFLRLALPTDSSGLPTDQVLTAMSEQGIPGGLISPNMALQGLSRSIGPVAGTVRDVVAAAGAGAAAVDAAAGVLSGIASGDSVSPSSFLDTVVDSALTGSKMFGIFALRDILPKDLVTGVKDAAGKLPSFVTRGLDSVQNVLHMADQAWSFLGQIGPQLEEAVSQANDRAAAALAAVQAAGNDAAAAAAAAAAATAAAAAASGLALVQSVIAKVQKVIEAAFGTIKATIEAMLRKAKELVEGIEAQIGAGIQGLSIDDLGVHLGNALGAFLDVLTGKTPSIGGSITINVPVPSFDGNPADLTQGKVDSLTGITLTPITIPIPGGKTLDSVLGEAKALADTVRRTIQMVIDKARQFEKMIEDEIGDIEKFIDTYVVKAMALYAKGQKLIEDQVLSIEWKTKLVGVGVSGSTSQQDQALFWPGPSSQLALVGEARAKAKGAQQAGVEITASLDAFDIQLLAPLSVFMILKFKKVALVISTRKKPEIDIVFDKFVFAGPLSFFNTLKEMLPLDGFSDPPAVQVSPSGIIADFSLGLPDIAVGIFSLSNLAVSAGCTIPFLGSALSVRFGFCSSANPFLLTVCALGGSGYFSIEISPGGVEKLELSLAAAAAISLNFGVASGIVSVTAGFTLKLEKDLCSLTGFLKISGAVSVLGGLFSASLQLYLSLTYESHTCPNGAEGGLLRGRASLEVSVSLLFFSASVTIECERTFAGSNGDPTFEQVMAPLNQLPADSSLTAAQWPWREYVDAFDAAA